MADEQNMVITIARQLGAGGAPLGQRLAARLGFAYVDRDILKLAAEKIGMPREHLEHWEERVSSVWERFIDSLAVSPPEAFYTSLATLPTIRDERLFEMESRVIREVAARRNSVIIGRGGFWVLKDHPKLLRIFLHSPPEARVAEVKRALTIKTDDEARKTIDEVDKERERFVRAMTGRSLVDARNYDLSIDTQKISLEMAEEMIAGLVKDMNVLAPK